MSSWTPRTYNTKSTQQPLARVWRRQLHVGYYLDIQHAHNVGEIKIGRFLVDSFDVANRTVYEFNGCYFHGHDCEINQNDYNERVGAPMSVLYERTIQRKRYLEDRRFTVVDIWECEYCMYKQKRKSTKTLKLFRQNYVQGLDLRTTMHVRKRITR